MKKKIFRAAILEIDGVSEEILALKDETLTAKVYNDKEGQAGAMLGLPHLLGKGEPVATLI